MDIIGILKGLLTAITGLFLSFTGTTATPAAIEQLASSTDAVVIEAAASSDSSAQIKEAYDLGKAVGKLQAKAEAVAQATSTIIQPTQPPMTSTGSTGTGQPSNMTGGSTGTETVTVTQPATAPEVVSKASIEIISPISGKGLGRTYKAAPEVVDESNYLVIAAIVRNDAGEAIDNAHVEVTATDASQNKSFNGSGQVTPRYVNGQKVDVPIYTFNYEFHQAGEHVITFSANGMTQAVTVTAQ